MSVKFEKKISILFVCGGNTCRSPIAAALTARAAGNRPIKVESVGIDADTGSPASEEAITVLNTLGMDARLHRSRNISEFDLRRYDYIVAMKVRIADEIRSSIPKETTRLITWDVSDPWGHGIDACRQSAQQIQGLVEELLKMIPSRERAS
jgi:protein-tyrosine-phosphatase